MTVNFERYWAMPSHKTFTIAPFKKLIDNYKDRPLDDAAVKKGYKIFTKKSYVKD